METISVTINFLFEMYLPSSICIMDTSFRSCIKDFFKYAIEIKMGDNKSKRNFTFAKSRDYCLLKIVKNDLSAFLGIFLAFLQFLFVFFD